MALTLADEIDISRGDMIVKKNNPPKISQDIEAMICWFSNKPMASRAKLILRHTSREMQAIVSEVKLLVDINTLHKVEGAGTFTMNDIGLHHPAHRAAGDPRLVSPQPAEPVPSFWWTPARRRTVAHAA